VLKLAYFMTEWRCVLRRGCARDTQMRNMFQSSHAWLDWDYGRL